MRNKLFAVIVGIALPLNLWAAESDTSGFNKQDFKNYVMEMVKRSIVVQHIQVLRKTGYDEQAIADILQTPSFEKFVNKVVHAPAIERVVDQKIRELLAPGYLEGKIQAKIAESEIQNREALLLALQELNQYRNRPSKNFDEPLDNFFTKLWKQVKKDLFG